MKCSYHAQGPQSLALILLLISTPVFPQEVDQAADQPWPISWRASPESKECSGPVDEARRLWTDPAFDDSDWAEVTFPDKDTLHTGRSRFYRGTIELGSNGDPVFLDVASDDGIAVFVNGQHLGQYGPAEGKTLCESSRCVNRDEHCYHNVNIGPIQIPPNLLASGQNLIAIHLYNGAWRNSYLDAIFGPAEAIRRRTLWVYSANPERVLQTTPNAKLKDLFIAVEKIREPGVPSTYRISVLSNNKSKSFRSGILNLLVSEDIDVFPESFKSFRHVDVIGNQLLQNILLAENDYGWQDLAVVEPLVDGIEKGIAIGFSLISFIPYVGTGMAGMSVYEALSELWPTDIIRPSTAFLQKAEDVNNYDSHILSATRLTTTIGPEELTNMVLIPEPDMVYGLRFVTTLHESNGVPEFFVKVKHGRDIIGVTMGEEYRNPYVMRNDE